MTYSIVARDGDSFGVAVASKFLGVGGVVPAASAAAGALATQALANVAYKANGMALLGSGMSAGEVITRLLVDDPARELRQLGVVDRDGGSASWTGADCFGWCGGRTGDGYACQGNMLAGAEVIDAMGEAFEASRGHLADRLVASLASGQVAGGERRGRQAAAVLIVRPEGGYGRYDDKTVDLRVDDHSDPLGELSRLLGLWHLDLERRTGVEEITDLRRLSRMAGLE